MGIGASFAMGLVSGFTRNIELERERRLTDQQKVDLLEQQLFKSITEGDATSAGVESASALIKSARTQLNEREPIDMFGTQTDGMDLDFASMKSAIDSVSTYGTSYGTGANVFGTTIDINDSPNTAKAYMFLNEAESLLGDESVIAKMAAGGPSVQNQFVANIQGAYGIIMNNMATNKVPGEQMLIPTFGPNVENIINGEAAIIDFMAENTGADGVFINETENGREPEPFTFENENAKASFSTIANNVLPQGTNPAQFGEYYYKNYLSLVPGMTPDKKGRYLDGTVSLGIAIPNIAALDPEVGITTDEMAVKYYPVIQSIAGNSMMDQVLMLAPHMTPPNVQKTNIAGFRTIVTGETAQQYVLRATGNKYKTFGELETTASAINTTYDELVRLQQIRSSEEMGSVAAYNAFKKYAFGVVDFTTAAAKDVFGSMAKGIEDPNRVLNEAAGERYIDEQYLEELQNRINNSKYAEYEALNIALAFKMARAADPSGRLSNQDIEQQLRRLGDPMDSQEAALAKIGILIDEIGAERDKLKVLVDYGKSTDVISQDRARVIDAALVVRDLHSRSKNSAANQVTSETFTRSENPISTRQTKDGGTVFVAIDESSVPMTPMIFLDENGNRINDDQIVIVDTPPPPAAETPAPAPATETAPPAAETPAPVAAETAPPAATETAPVTPEATPPVAVEPPAADANQPTPDADIDFNKGGDNVVGMVLKGYEGRWKWDNGQWNKVN